MTTIHAQAIGDKLLLSREQVEQLLRLARLSDDVELQVTDHDVTTREMMYLAELGSAFDFWREAGENVYSIHDGEPI